MDFFNIVWADEKRISLFSFFVLYISLANKSFATKLFTNE